MVWFDWCVLNHILPFNSNHSKCFIVIERLLVDADSANAGGAAGPAEAVGAAARGLSDTVVAHAWEQD